MPAAHDPNASAAAASAPSTDPVPVVFMRFKKTSPRGLEADAASSCGLAVRDFWGCIKREPGALAAFASCAAEFKDLCYLLTCKSVQEVLRNWEGTASARQQLAEQYCSMRELTPDERPDERVGTQPVPPRRLLRLLQSMQNAKKFDVYRSHEDRDFSKFRSISKKD